MAKAKKFGAISGVFTPSILTILGVIMYLRLPWIVGQAGLWATIGIILVAHIISFTTSLSVSSIATDKKVETGGSYYIISRSLGLPIGGTLGLALFVGLSFSVSLYLIGFAEVFLNFFGMEASLNNIRIAGGGALLVLTILTFISTSLALKVQYIILAALLLSLVSVFLGNHDFDPSQPLIAPMQGALPWITLFAIFFPAVTGFEAGVSMSGDLKDPRKNIPVGTISAVLVGLVVYLGLAFFLSHTVSRDMLANNPSVLFQIAWVPQLVVAGIWGATLSSALGSILGAPRILQATSIDRITPAVLGKGFGASNEPRNALIFTFIIALSGILIGELDVIARIVTIFFIITYGFLNITYAIESWAGTDFRPSFKIPGLISIIGAVACIVVMIQLDVVAMIGASLVLVGLFLFLKRRELTLQTGDTWNSVWASLVKTGLGKLTTGNQEPRNWRPNVILFSGGAKNRPYLIDTAKALVGKLGIFTNFELVESRDEKNLFSKNQQIISEEVKESKGVFTRRHVCRDVYEGIESISKIYGFSGFDPNTILMGWPANTRKPEAFARLVKSFVKLDYNQVYLSYDKNEGFRKKKSIDIWWSGKGRNISFALSIVRFITSSDEWRQATLRILVINPRSDMADKYYELLAQILDNQRIKAEVKVINNSVEQLPEQEILRNESRNTDLTIIEMDPRKEDFYEQINQLTENLSSCMVVNSSGFFEEVNLVTKPTDERVKEEEKTEKPGFEILPKIKLAQREIVANEVHNIATHLQGLTHKYYNDSLNLIMEKGISYFAELQSLTEKTSEQLASTCKMDDEVEMKGEFLKILNDFSFQAQSKLKLLKHDILVNYKQILASGAQNYFRQTELRLRDMPAYLRVKYDWKEFRRLKADSFVTGLFKVWKIFRSRITGKPAVYNIKVERAARYYLYHKRLVEHAELYDAFARHTFESIIESRKILQDFYEMIEKGKSGAAGKDKMGKIVQMEKDRFKVAIALQKEREQDFYHELGHKLEARLLNDLQLFSNLLDRPGANFLSRAFPKACKNDPELLENLTHFPDNWHMNANLMTNKIYLDFLLQSLKNRIEAKIRKYHFDFNTSIHAFVLQPLQELKKTLEALHETGKNGEKPDRSGFREFAAEKHYDALFDEINTLFPELPLVLSIAGDDLSGNIENNRLELTQERVVSVRKTVEFSIASELIDYVKKQGMEFSNALAGQVAEIKDVVRLVNFNFFEETDDEIQGVHEKRELAEDFLKRVVSKQDQIQQLMAGYEASFGLGLKNAFAPLSSSIIAKTSGSIKKKFKAGESQKLWERVQDWNNQLVKGVQNQLVNVVYSKSESVLWMGKMEKNGHHLAFSNEEVYAYLDKYSPNQEVLNQLPFYYGKLFSGQSGIGEDFWVGMEDEVRQMGSAVKRFRNGQPGCIIITGERNSGKTSLGKYTMRQHFQAEEILNIRAPMECTASVELFEQSLLKALNSHNTQLDVALKRLQRPRVFIINDLELWWERTPEGTLVVERLMELIKAHHGKVLFVINVNIHALMLINELTSLHTWALAQVVCSGFDARELHDMVKLRHQAGGMKFSLDKKHESQISGWEYAGLFNRFFDLSRGNPGMTIGLWLASIKKVSGNTLYMEKLPKPDYSFLEKLNRDQLFYLLQFVYHLRLSMTRLAHTLDTDKEALENQLLNLWQSGILVEKFPGIYAINPALQQPLVKIMSEMKLL